MGRRTKIRSFGAAALALLSAGGRYWTVPGQGANRQAHNTAEDLLDVDNVVGIVQLWSAPTDEGPVGAPVTSAAGVHVNDAHGVYGFNPDTGARLWRHPVTAPLVAQQPWVQDSTVLAGQWNPVATASAANEGLDVTLALDAATGAAQATSPQANGSVIGLRGQRELQWNQTYFPTRPATFWAQRLRVTDASTGTVVCCDGPFRLSSATAPAGPEPITLGSGWIFHAGQGVIDPGTAAVGNGVRGVSIANPALCLGLYTCPTWLVTTDGTTATAPVLSDDQSVVYSGTDAGTMYAVQVTGDTASVLWSTPVGSAVTASPALADGRLFVPTASGQLVALDAATGAELWRGNVVSSIDVQPAVANGVVYAGTAGGFLVAFDASPCGATTCNPLQVRDVGSAITGAPAVSGGHVYVGTDDGHVVAYGLPAG